MGCLSLVFGSFPPLRNIKGLGVILELQSLPDIALIKMSIAFSVCLALLALGQSAWGSAAFYPYGGNSDSRVPIADDNFVNMSINPLQFYGRTYYKIYVNNNGGLSFLRGVPEFTPNCGPLNTPMIVPYWADVNTILGGTVYYGMSTDAGALSQARAEVSAAFPYLNTRSFYWLFIATWDNVAFFGATPQAANCSGLSKRNTFQTVLVSDGSLSFAIFNFRNITWTTGTASGGDCNGLGGTPAKSGFDVGDGANFFSLPGSCSSQILDVTRTSNVGVPGKWIFRVDQEPILNNTSNATMPNVTTTTQRPIPDGECDPDQCELTGHCVEYYTCDPNTRRRVTFQCSDGLYWNPHSTPTTGNTTHWGGSNNTWGGYVPAPYNNYTQSNYSWNYPYNSSIGSYYAAGRSLLPQTRQWGWNTTNGTTTVNTTTQRPPAECHGSCDIWDNLSAEVQALYKSDQECFPRCYYEGLGECQSHYIFHAHNSDKRNVELLTCPTDTRQGRNIPMVWVQDRESCDFCYNAHGNGFDFINGTNQWTGNSTACCSKYDSDILPINENMPIPVITGRQVGKGQATNINLGKKAFDVKHKK